MSSEASPFLLDVHSLREEHRDECSDDARRSRTQSRDASSPGIKDCQHRGMRTQACCLFCVSA